MLFKLAWRNIWRNKRRSFIVFISVIVGVNAMLFMDGMSNGMLSQILFNEISLNVSHIQIHKNGFTDNKMVQNYMPDYENVEKIIITNKSIRYYSKRIVTFGLLSSAANSTGIYLNGIEPENEQNVSRIKSSIIEGKYLSGNSGEIVIGKKLAEKLQVELGDKVVALANTSDGSIGSDVFRIVGIYKSPSSEFDKSYVYIPITNAQTMLNLQNKIHEFAIITNNYNSANIIRDKLRETLSGSYEVLSYEDLLPFVIIQLDMYKESLFVINLIISLALIFGIINSMLMSVFERIREIGVLMSIGMRNGKIFLMILIEAFTIGTAGTIIGVISGYLINIPFSTFGINLSVFAQSLESFAVGAILYPKLSVENFVMILLMIPLISILGALYPAYKAIKLEPVYAIRYI
ncbi:MAG: ABC transporter permease [Ignavibacteriae bacterium HGW-Ignavibacteriae-2]|jgi:ABC-type lipoprotein release transport system permease subunit|nr:MAG: ABC transporter permease [Ignavibacteriae bacterium HGW-Ignavibacteriae-2]